MSRRWKRAAILTLLAFAGCTSAEPGAGIDARPSDTTSAAEASSTGPETLLGGFFIDRVPAVNGAAAYTDILGKVYDGAVPSPIVWSVVEEASGCRLLTPRVPFCFPGCGGAAICVSDGQCAAYPTPQNLGKVRVSGVGTGVFDMEAISGSYQPSASVSVPEPPFAEGDMVAMTTSGGAFAPFTLTSRGVATLTVSGNFALASGQSLVISWPPPRQTDASRIEVKLDISHHGGTKGKIECDVDDDGSLEIPASQITRLLALGAAGFPTIAVTRVASGTAQIAQGRVSLRVTSMDERAVEVPGVRSCTEDGHCSEGQTCKDDLTCK